GRALIQTYDPASPVIAALLSGDAERFYESEIAERRAAGLPPFGRLASLIIAGPRGPEALAHARALVQSGHRLVEAARMRAAETVARASSPPLSGSEAELRAGSPRYEAGAESQRDPVADLLVLGPAEAPIAVIRGRHRFR